MFRASTSAAAARIPWAHSAAARSRLSMSPLGPPHLLARRHLAFLSPRQVLRSSRQSSMTTCVILAAFALHYWPDWQPGFADKITRFATSVDWTQDALEKRTWAYQVLAKVPRTASLPDVNESSPHVQDANASECTHVQLRVFGKDLIDSDVATLDVLFTHLRDTLNTATLGLVPASVGATLRFFGAINQIQSDLCPAWLRPPTPSATDPQAHDPLPLTQPGLGTRGCAWLVDSVCVGLVASPLWRTSLFGAAVTLTWLAKDYVFPLVPGLRASPGYHLLGLEKVHVATANQARAQGSAPDTLLAQEVPGMLGHNTYRFFVWCNTLVDKHLWVGASWAAACLALKHGLAPTVLACDRIAGVQVVHRDELVVVDKTGKLPSAQRGGGRWMVEVGGSGIKSHIVNARLGMVVDWKVEVVPGGTPDARAKMVVTKRMRGGPSEGEEAQSTEIELPRWIKVNGSVKQV